ncbi:hypothetical protein [Allobaculum stercoricanis]|uniref:hypothetical protein n=1 Tax=Allobaculum stercoricanis TaxID=174709 RepID=UPI000369D65D|nr:hypothetical protein [Allobaculum stercoricanis]
MSDKERQDQTDSIASEKNDHPINNDIDEYTQKLLDRRAELTLFPDDDEDFTSSSLEGSLTDFQRRNAEQSMLNALDQLRKERGQVSIAEEERNFEQNGEKREGHQNEGKEEYYKGIVPNRYENSNRLDHFLVTEPRPQTKKELWKRPIFWVIFCGCIMIATLFGAFAWKVTVYDPQHATDVDQAYAYRKLVNYADEFPMMSDRQKKEIVNLEADFNSLPLAKKDEINTYFSNPKHTGKTFTALLEEYKKTIEVEQDSRIQELLDLARNWQTIDGTKRNTVVDYYDVYQALEENQKETVNQAFKEGTGLTFVEVYNQTSAGLSGVPVQTNADIQAQIDSLTKDRDNYLKFLQEEGESGENDAILQQYNEQIAALQAKLQ